MSAKETTDYVKYRGLTLWLLNGKSWGSACDVDGCYEDEKLHHVGPYVFCERHYDMLAPEPGMFIDVPPLPATVTQSSTDIENDIINRFSYHAPKGGQLGRYDEIRTRARTLALHLVKVTPASREQSTALTKLEEAVMWANAAIARNK